MRGPFSASHSSKATMPEPDIAIEAPWPDTLDWEDIAARAAAAAAEVAPELANPRLSFSLLFADDAEVHALNRDWRGKDKPTNVLSFPMLDRDDLLALAADGPPELLGDIALALETCGREAAEKSASLEHHAAHLIIHGRCRCHGSTGDKGACPHGHCRPIWRPGLTAGRVEKTMASHGHNGDSHTGEPDSRRTLWRAIRRFFDRGDGDQSLRAQLEEAIDEHEDEADGAATAAGDLSLTERQMVRNLLHFSEHDADDVAIPRGEIIALPSSATWEEVVDAFAVHGHSRLPVYCDTLDEIVGMVLIKDVFPFLAGKKPPPKDWNTLLRQPLFVPQARGALDVLADMRASRVHLAIVVDEYSGTDGIITFEDLVEEIVGEIEDEHDDAPQDMLLLLDDGTWNVDSRAELEDVGERIDPRLAEVEEAVDTLGGLTFLLAGQVPPVGSILEHDSGWKIEVTAGNNRHVTRLRLHPPVPTETPED